MTIKIAIYLEGGNVNWIEATSEEGLEIILVDHDNQAMDKLYSLDDVISEEKLEEKLKEIGYESWTEPEKKVVIPDGFEKESFLWKMWLDGIKTTGSLDDALSYIEENLTISQYNELYEFSSFLFVRDLTVGWGNYFDHYMIYKNWELEINHE